MTGPEVMGCRLARRLVELCARMLRSAVSFRRIAGRHPDGLPVRARAIWLHESTKALLPVFNLELEVHGKPPADGLLVSNHLSYLDIPVLASLAPVLFVAKAEVRDWPLLGWFARRAGTIFLNRASRADLVRVDGEIHAALQEGQPVVVFPEGSSSDGRRVLPFKTSLFRSAAAGGFPVRVAALDYSLEDGTVEQEVCYWGEMSLLPHLLRLLTKRCVKARVRFSNRVFKEADRKELAAQVRTEICRLLGQRPS